MEYLVLCYTQYTYTKANVICIGNYAELSAIGD